MASENGGIAGDLAPVFAPASIAVVGASTDPTKFGSRLLERIRTGGYTGTVFPVHPRAPQISGYPTVPALAELASPVDLALLCGQAASIPGVLSEAANSGIRAAIVYTAGLDVTQLDDGTAEDAVRRIVPGSGIRLIGPNCLGIRNFHLGLHASPGTNSVPGPGGIALISQSGAFGNAAFAAFRDAGVGLSVFASLGNMVDVSHADVVDYLIADSDTRVFALFVEGTRDPATLLDTVQRASRDRPVVVLKAGRSAVGRAAAASHTGSLAGDGQVWDSLLHDAGATVVSSTGEMFDVAAAFERADGRLPRGRRVGIVTVAGGPAVLAADRCEQRGLDVPGLDAVLAPLRDDVPPFASLGNPVDVTGQLRRDRFATCVDAVVDSDAVDCLIGIAMGLEIPEFGDALIAAKRKLSTVTAMRAPALEERLAAGGVANFATVERAVDVLAHLADRADRLRRADDAEPPAEPARQAMQLAPGVYAEVDAQRRLAECGIGFPRSRVATTVDEAVAAARDLGYPVVLKASSPSLVHKTELGAVRTNIDEHQVEDVAADLLAKFDGAKLLVVETIVGTELLLGAVRDASHGAFLAVGIGGALTEAIGDVVYCRAPTTTGRMMDALSRLRLQRILDGYRGAPAVDREAVAALGVQLGDVMAANPRVAEIDLNPVISSPVRTVPVDALLRVTAG